MGLKFSKQKPKRDTVLETLITQIVQEVQEVQAVQTDSVMTDTKELQTEYAVQDKELQTTFPPVEICVICITKPNYTYFYEGLLKDAPHMKRGLTAEQWATQAEAALEKQRKGCEWVKHHTMMRDRFVQLHMDSRRNSGPETIPVSWKALPEMPPCMYGCAGDPQRIRCQKTGVSYYGIGRKLHKGHTPSGCLPHCYYKYTNELEAHYKTCTTCKDPVL